MTKRKEYALVTRATSGIGYELTKLLAADGYDLILVSRTQADLEKVAGARQSKPPINPIIKHK